MLIISRVPDFINIEGIKDFGAEFTRFRVLELSEAIDTEDDKFSMLVDIFFTPEFRNGINFSMEEGIFFPMINIKFFGKFFCFIGLGKHLILSDGDEFISSEGEAEMETSLFTN